MLRVPHRQMETPGQVYHVVVPDHREQRRELSDMQQVHLVKYHGTLCAVSIARIRRHTA